MPRRVGSDSRARGNIRKRGNSFQINVYAGTDPVTGKRLYLSESSTDEKKAEKILTRLLAEVDKQRNARTRATFGYAVDKWLQVHDVEASSRAANELYVRRYVRPALGDEPIHKVSALVLESLYAQLRRCRELCEGKPRIDHRVDGPHECREVQHKRPPGRPPARGYPPHDCTAKGCRVIECQPHECRPLADATILKIHFVISSVFAAAIRWGWVESNPCDVARKPKQPVPDPDPPTAEEAARIVEAAWKQDPMWGTFVWLVMVTGMRRGEALALRWHHVNFNLSVLDIRRSYQVVEGRRVEKDTKTHQRRRPALDPATVEVLTEHRERYEQVMREVGREPKEDAYLFSYEPSFDQPCNPDGVTHRYERMCKSIGLDSHLHALRHYNATELLSAGVDLRTVAGRLGHAGGGATTLRVYAAWSTAADQKAADVLGGRMQRPESSNNELHKVPAAVAEAAAERWPDRAGAWSDAVHAELGALCAQYDAQPVRMLPARFAFVVTLRTKDGATVVARSTADPAGLYQAKAAQELAELGAGPQVFGVVSTRTGTWTVMECVQPGSLAGSCTTDELVAVLSPLVTAQDSSCDLPRLSAWLRRRLTGGPGSDVDPGADVPSEGERAQALDLLNKLEPQEHGSICHGDLSLGNVLRGEKGLQLIDPRGVSGDVEYDVAVLALKAGIDSGGLVRRLAVRKTRVQAWGQVAIAARV